MLIIPAIDIKEGRVVRLYQGKADQESVYSERPADMALRWAREGAGLIHVVDLDGAFSGTPKNLGLLKNIFEVFKEEGVNNVKVEFGGGVRTKEDIEEALSIGACRVVLGTIAFEDRDFLEKAVSRYGDKIIVSIDVKAKGRVALKGWVEDAGKDDSLLAFVKYLHRIGINKVIYTDIAKDGTLSGPGIDLLSDYLDKFLEYKISVIVAGGISSLKDIESLKKFEAKGLEGVIVGKALYEGRFTLKDALMLAAPPAAGFR
jgi:phosphoribosylformimino-5-aminoimidazole carboxamide ribotide isomerase